MKDLENDEIPYLYFLTNKKKENVEKDNLLQALEAYDYSINSCFLDASFSDVCEILEVFENKFKVQKYYSFLFESVFSNEDKKEEIEEDGMFEVFCNPAVCDFEMPSIVDDFLLEVPLIDFLWDFIHKADNVVRFIEDMNYSYLDFEDYDLWMLFYFVYKGTKEKDLKKIMEEVKDHTVIDNIVLAAVFVRTFNVYDNLSKCGCCKDPLNKTWEAFDKLKTDLHQNKKAKEMFSDLKQKELQITFIKTQNKMLKLLNDLEKAAEKDQMGYVLDKAISQDLEFDCGEISSNTIKEVTFRFDGDLVLKVFAGVVEYCNTKGEMNFTLTQQLQNKTQKKIIEQVQDLLTCW